MSRRPRLATSRRRGSAVVSRAVATTRVLLLCAAAATVGVVGYTVITALLRMPLETVVITGELENLDESELRAAIAPNLHTSLPSTDLTALQESLADLPWVKEVELTRRWPETLEIAVVERTAIARWHDDALVDYDGVVFAPRNIPTGSELPGLSGPAGREFEVFSTYRRFVEQLAAYQLTVSQLALNSRGSWTARLSDGTGLVLGRQEIDARLQRFLEARSKLLASPDGDKVIAQADLRYGNGLAIRWAVNESRIALNVGDVVQQNKTREQPTHGQRTGT